MTGVATASIFDVMEQRRIKRRSLKQIRKTNPPFGYSWLEGELVVNPTEYKTVKVIRDLHASGMKPYHIEKYLNERSVPTRSGGKWFSRIVTDILGREVNDSDGLF